MIQMWKTTCKVCHKEFTSDIKERVENDLIVHHQDKHKGIFLEYDDLTAEEEEE